MAAQAPAQELKEKIRLKGEEMEPLTISIVVPVYRVEKELPRCVQSIRTQTYPHMEIILVDDGSPDGSPALCDRYAEEDPRITVIHKQNGGLSSARNAGLAKAQGEYVLFVDSDDCIEPDACERFLRAAAPEYPDVVVGEARQINGKSTICMGHDNLAENRVYSGREYAALAISALQWYAPSCLNLYKTEFLKANGLFFQEGLLHEDMEYLPRVFLRDITVKYMKGAFYQYIIREDSITQKQRSMKNAQMLFGIYQGWKDLFEKEANTVLYPLLQGFLMKCYMYTCREYQLPRRDGNMVSISRAIHYSLNLKECIKACIFSILPQLYIKL